MNNNQMLVNLPVKDLQRSKAFFSALGYGFKPEFTDDKAACMIVSEDHSYVMLLVEPFFQSFIKTPVADARSNTEVLIALSRPDRAAVDDTVARALAAGGGAAGEVADYGFMYQHSFADPDGHLWEVFCMDGMPPASATAAPQ